MDHIDRARARSHLDALIDPFRAVNPVRPPKGWLRAIRDALGLTGEQVAARLGIKQPSLAALEKSEMSATISLRTLRYAAEALDCDLVYALVPRTTLTGRVAARAERLARQRLARSNHTMTLEDQGLDKTASDAALRREIDAILSGPAGRLWEEE